MPEAIPYAMREEIVRRHKEGESLQAIAQAMGYSYWGVRKIWRHYRDQGEEGLRIRYDRCGPSGIKAEGEVYEQAMGLKREHPRWGAGIIRLLLQERLPDRSVPSERTLQRWWQKAGINQRPTRRVKQNTHRAQAVHEVWEIDAVESRKLKEGGGVSWVTITDEKSGAVLEAELFPPGADQ